MHPIRLHILIDQQRHGALQTLAKRAGLSSADLVRAAIDQFLATAAANQAITMALRPDDSPSATNTGEAAA
jgi:hypothetical protein